MNEIPVGRSPAQDDLALIRRLMMDSRRLLVDSGRQYVLWSVLALLGIALKYLLDALGNPFPAAWMWLGIFAVGALFTCLLGRRSRRETGAVTFAQRILTSVQTGWGAGIPILTLIGYYTGAISSWAIPPVVATTFGSACYILGVLSGNRWFRNTAFAWWAGAVVMFLMRNEHTILIIAALFIILQLIPGLILHRRWKAALANDS